MIYKKILYIGPYREFSGAGNSARNYIHALYKSGHDVCISPIYITGDIYPENEISSEILPLENNYLKNYDIIIQHCHPFEWVHRAGHALNIGIFQFNSLKLHPLLSHRLSLVDRVVVNSVNNETIVNRITTTKNIVYCPELIDTDSLNRNFHIYEWNNKKDKPYTFYLIGDFIDRKNFTKAISGYITAFSKNDNVQLILKTKPHYTHNNENILHKEIEYELEKIFHANKLSKERAPEIKIMIGKFTYDQLLNLHYNGDCFIDISMGENFGFSTLEAAMFQKDIIVNSKSSSNEIPDKKYSVLSSQVYIHDPHNNNMIDNRTTNMWSNIDFDNYVSYLKTSYLNRYENKSTKNSISKFTYDQVNALIC